MRAWSRSWLAARSGYQPSRKIAVAIPGTFEGDSSNKAAGEGRRHQWCHLNICVVLWASVCWLSLCAAGLWASVLAVRLFAGCLCVRLACGRLFWRVPPAVCGLLSACVGRCLSPCWVPKKKGERGGGENKTFFQPGTTHPLELFSKVE